MDIMLFSGETEGRETDHVKTMSYLHSSLSLAVTVRTVCWMSSFSSTSASYRFLSKYGGLSFLSAIPIRMNFDTEGKMTVSYVFKNCSLFI